MFLILPSTLLVAALISGPALWHALVVGDVPISTALARFLIAVPVSGLMMALLRSLTASYRSYARRTAVPMSERDADEDKSE